MTDIKNAFLLDFKTLTEQFAVQRHIALETVKAKYRQHHDVSSETAEAWISESFPLPEGVSAGRLPRDLTPGEREKAVRDLAEFYEFSFFDERNTEVGFAMTYALEMQACTLGLTGDVVYETDDYDTAVMMEEFVEILCNTARAMNFRPWAAFEGQLPYVRGSA